MALFTALFRNLNMNKNLEEKLSMAKKFYSSNLPIPNQTEPVISWILSYVETSKRELTNKEKLMLWKALEDALKYEKDENEHAVVLKSVYAEIITEEIERCNVDTLDIGEAVMSCTKYILWSPSMNSIFTAEYDTLMVLFSAVLKVIVLTCTNNCHQIQLIKNASQVLDGILGCLENLSYHKSNFKKVVSSIVQLLEPLAVFFHLSDGCSDADLLSMSDKLLSYLVTVIFGQPKCYQILLKLYQDKKGESEEGFNSISEFLSVLGNLFFQEAEVVGTIKICDAIASFIAKLMQGYLLHNRNEHLSGIHVLAVFCAVVGVDIPFMSSANISCILGLQPSNAQDDLKICALKKILQTCAAYQHHFNNYTEGTKIIRPVDWLRKLSVLILGMNYEASQCAWLGCLNSLLNISSVIFDYDLPLLMKRTWTEIHLVSLEAKQQHSLLFCSLLNVYCHLQQLPRFIEQVFIVISEAVQTNTGGQLICEGYISKPVEVSLAQSAAVLPCGQILELWKLLNSVETKMAVLWSSSQHKTSSCLSGAMLFTSRVHSIFLLHAKLFDEFTPPAVLSKVGDTIIETSEVIVKFSSLLQAQETEAHCEKSYNVCCSSLMLSHAIDETKLAYSLFTDKQVELPGFKQIVSVTDVSVLHPYLENRCVENIFSDLKMDTDLLSLSAIRLIVQKAKALVMKGCISELEKKHLKSTTTFLFKHTVASHSYVESRIHDHTASDNDHFEIVRNTIDLWHLMLKHIPLFIPFVGQNELMLLCCTMIDILVQGNQFRVETTQEETLSSVILQFISHEFFVESKKLQSAFVTAVWKHATSIIRTKKRSHPGDMDSYDVSKILQVLCNSHAEWTKHASSTPKHTEKEGSLNAMWLMVENVAALIQEWLEIHSESKNKFKVQDALQLMKLINYLPLEYLLPGNQMRCTLGLSVLMLLLPNCLHKTNSEEIQELAVSIFKAQRAIFEGVRSIWLFDFVKAEPFLKSVVQTLAMVNVEGNDQTLYWSQSLLEKLFTLSMRNASSLEALENYAYELAANITESKVTLLATCVMFQRLVSLLQRHYLEQKFKEHCTALAIHVGSSVIKCLKRELKPDCSICSLLVKCYFSLFELPSGEALHLEHEKECMWLKKLPDVVDAALDAIQSSQLPQRSHLEEKFKEICISLALTVGGAAMKFLKGKGKPNLSVQSLLIKCCVGLLELASGEICTLEEESIQERKMPSVIDIALHAVQSSSNANLHKNCMSGSVNGECLKEKKGDNSLILDFPEKQCSDLLKLTSDKTISWEWERDQKWLKEIPGIIDIALDVIQPSNSKEKVDMNFQRMLSKMAQKYLARINYILTVNEESSTNLLHRASYFKCMALLLKKLGSNLPRQAIVQCLHPCIALHVDKYTEDPCLFASAFDAIWNILNELIVHHPYTVLATRPAFLTCVANLLRATIKAGNESFFLSYTPAKQQEIVIRAQNIDRLLTSLSKYETEFQKMVPYLITVYVELLQNITLHPSIKVHITSGINRLFNMCSEDSIKMLSVSIGFEGREIYSTLVKNYKQTKYTGNT